MVGLSLVAIVTVSLATVGVVSFISESVADGVSMATHVVSSTTLVLLESNKLFIAVSMETSAGLLSSVKNVSLAINCLGVNDSQQLGAALVTRVSLDQFIQERYSCITMAT